MAEEVGMGIRKFSGIVAIKFSKLLTFQPDSKQSVDEFTMDRNYKEIFNSIDLLLTSNKEFIDEVNIDIIEERYILSSKTEYMAYLLSRCLKLSEGNPTFFEFLLVCVYIAKISECVFDKYKCCKVLKVTADSLEAIYCRKYWDYFKDNGEFLGLSRFCKKLNKSSQYEECENEKCMTLFEVLEPTRNEKVKIFNKSLNEISDDISLNAMEVKLLKDKTFFIPYKEEEDFLISFILGAREARELDKEGWEVVPEKAIKTGIRCSRCNARCFQYLAYFVKEFPRFKNIPEF